MTRPTRIPKVKRAGRKHADAPELLGWVLKRFTYRRRRTLSLPDGHSDIPRTIALLVLLRLAGSHATAILRAARAGVSDAAHANLRAMLELRADFTIVARDPGRSSVRRMKVAGALAMLRRIPDPALERSLAVEFADVYSEVKARHSKSPHKHWTGAGRKDVIIRQLGADHGALYEFLSWDAHPIVQVLLDVSEAADSRSFRVAHRTSQKEAAQLTCLSASQLLLDMWNEFVEVYPKAPAA